MQTTNIWSNASRETTYLDKQELVKLTVVELKTALKKKGLSIEWTKAQLERWAQDAGLPIQLPPKMKKAELQKALEEKGLSSLGSKTQLEERATQANIPMRKFGAQKNCWFPRSTKRSNENSLHTRMDWVRWTFEEWKGGNTWQDNNDESSNKRED